MKVYIKIQLIAFVAISFSSCDLLQNKAPEAKPLAKVFETYLYPSDIQGLVPKGASKQDSISIVKKYVKSWTEEQTLLHQAENNLGEKQRMLPGK